MTAVLWFNSFSSLYRLCFLFEFRNFIYGVFLNIHNIENIHSAVVVNVCYIKLFGCKLNLADIINLIDSINNFICKSYGIGNKVNAAFAVKTLVSVEVLKSSPFTITVLRMFFAVSPPTILKSTGRVEA